jgi:hypothetical protein
MRTTLDLAEDVLLAVKERARRENRSAGEVLSDLAREALTRLGEREAGDPAASFYGFEPLPPRGPVVSTTVIDRLRDDEPE